MISANEYAERRLRLIGMMEPLSAIVLYSGVEKVSSADEFYPFEVNRNFYYLTGINQPDSVLVLINSDGELREFLFILPFDERKEKWYGKRLKPEEAASISGIRNVLQRSGLEAKIVQMFDPASSQYGDIETLYLDLDEEIKIGSGTTTRDYKDTILAAYPRLKVADAYPLVTELRLRKSAREIAALRSAIASTQLGIYSVWAAMKPSRKEYEMADIFAHVINDDNGYEGLAFPTIAASGIHATILHYPTPMDSLKSGDLFLMDCGARKDFYCADVTRVAPINGRFTEFQRMVYEIVLGANKMVAKMARPGVSIEELQNATVEYLASECLKNRLIRDKKEIDRYYFHSVSHFIGLDTHDPWKAPNSRDYKKIKLEPGMVISDEPGLYIPEHSLGIRIEDDLLITSNGCEVLTSSIVKEVDEIESRLAKR